MKSNETKRLYHIVQVMLNYGLDELLWDSGKFQRSQWFRKSLFWLKNEHSSQPYGERLRLALQELGPVWVKFGQMMSTRRDLFPPDISDELALLQDRVEPFDGLLAKQQIEQALGGDLTTWFDDFDETPLASASIAQVHTATLKQTNQAVVLKIIRPNIEQAIRADIKLMYRVAGLVARFLPDARRLKPVEVIREYEKTLLDELDLMREAANTIQLRRNFEDDRVLYIPEVFSDYCRPTLMVSERVYGIQVSDIESLQQHGVNMKLLAERGVEVFFTQVFRDSFFHADMHPGNVFVSYDTPEDPTWIGLDCGIIGTLNRDDKRYLAENFLAFFNRDYRRVAELHVDSGWVPFDTNIDEFEAAIRTVCEPIFEKPLCDISFGHVLLNLFNTARRFNMEVQPQLVLLQKTLLYVEGLGRQLYPQLDLWNTAKPFLEQWMSRQIGPQAMWQNIKDKAPIWMEKLPELPDLVFDSLQQGRQVNQKLDIIYQQYMFAKKHHNRGKFWLGVGGVLLIASAILYGNQVDALPLLAGMGTIFSWYLAWRAINI